MGRPHCSPARWWSRLLGFALASVLVTGAVACASGELAPRSANDPANPNAAEAPPLRLAPAETGQPTSEAARDHGHFHGGGADAGATLHTH